MQEEFLLIIKNHFFIFRDGMWLKSSHLRMVLCKTLTNLNLNPKLYSVHSLRIGRTMDLFQYGYTVDQIKKIGRWKSNAVFRYIRN